MSVKVSFSSWDAQLKYGAKGAIALAAKAGFDGVDYSLESYGKGPLPDLVSMSQEEFVKHFTELKAYADELGVDIPTVHGESLPYGENEAENEIIRKKVLREIEAAALLGAEYCVIHSASTVIWGYDATPEFMHEINQRMYNDFIPTAEKFGVYITLESFGGIKVNGVPGYDYFANHKVMRDEYDSVNTKYKAFCVDTGHTNVAVGGGCLPVEDFIRYFGNRVKMLHMHDNNGFSDQHLMPPYGNVNWPAVFDALEEIGYDGYYNYEIVYKFGDCLEEATMLMGKFLREFTEKRGRI